MKNLLVFAGDDYYPGGGWCDLKGDFESIDKAKSFCQEIAPDNDWIQIVDIHSATFLYWGQMNDDALAKYYPNFQRLEIDEMSKDQMQSSFPLHIKS